MLYLLRNQDGTLSAARGTIQRPDGSARYLEPDEFQVAVEARWKSPLTSAEYPSRWSIAFDPAARTGFAADLRVIPLAADQENRGRLAGGLFYWEGAVQVQDASGARIGQGYVELAGYGTKNRPAL